jgi:hypothetical protein
LVRPAGSDADYGVQLEPLGQDLKPGTSGKAQLWFLFREYRDRLAVDLSTTVQN